MKKIYLCEQCGHQASSLANLVQHIATIHDLCKYNCHQCDFQAGSPLALKQHKKIKHDCIKFKCHKDKCNSWYWTPQGSVNCKERGGQCKKKGKCNDIGEQKPYIQF